MNEINIYCDESNHLESEKKRPLILAAAYCSRSNTAKLNKRIRDIKTEHGKAADYELKWSNITNQNVALYIDIVDYFFDNDDVSIRLLSAQKDTLDHKKHAQTHDEWYYKMYFTLLRNIIQNGFEYRICIDVKDTRGTEKVAKLRSKLSHSVYDFDHRIVKEIREVRSHQVPLVQIADIFAGALQFNMCVQEVESVAKRVVVNRIKERSELQMDRSTLPSEKKVNIFHWVGK